MLPDAFTTARLLLRPVTLMDVDAIFEGYAQDEEVARYLIWRPHRSRSETRAYVERCIATSPEIERTYVIVGREDNVVRGAFALRQSAPHRLDCGYVLARPWWRQGLMTEVLSEVAVWALAQSSVFRIGAVCDVENVGSARVLEKIGFHTRGSVAPLAAAPRTCRARTNDGCAVRDISATARMKGATTIWTMPKIVARSIRLRALCDHQPIYLLT